MSILIIADLHLSNNITLFKNFCNTQAIKADELYILGDLFDIYLGDDFIPIYYQQVIDVLKELSNTTKIFLMHGNRDFLIGKNFFKLSGVNFINDPYKIDKFVLSHGDSLVSGDVAYQRFKKIINQPIIKFLILQLPKKYRKYLAEKIQNKSHKEKQNKQEHIMDINQQALDLFMKKYPNCDIVHGHTHKQKIHSYKDYKRFVLGQWSTKSGNAINITDTVKYITIT